ncbi:uncharacterized protein LOC135492439 [Lineus longissimus]|uniref:uncharacterized protein LOC135492439 n=1 Tax=Lineus longissimus TaxID=88925 RepID=UPI00315CC41B
MKKLFVLISLALKVVSGLNMCIGPHDPPEIAKVITTPVYDYKNRMIEANVTIEVISSVPVYIQWLGGTGMTKTRLPWASEDNENFRSSMESSGNRHFLRLHAKQLDNITSVSDLRRNITVTLNVKYECNAVYFEIDLDELIRAQEQHMKLPTITEMPHIQNVIDEIGLNEIRVGFSYGPESEAPLVENSRCDVFFTRKNDTLRDVYDNYNPTDVVLKRNLGIAETSCIPVNFHKGLQSYYAWFKASVRSERPGGVIYEVSMYTGFRRNGVKKPAVMVHDIGGGEMFTPDGVLVLFTNIDEALIYCVGDAAKKPHIAVARIGRGGNFELQKPSPPPFVTFFETLTATTFIVKSPKLAEEDEYICSVISGNEVVNQRFKVTRHEPVHIERNEPAEEVTMDQAKKQYTFSCEATGVPQPKITFYYTSKPKFWYRVEDVADDKEHEIHDSDLFETTSRVEGTRTLGEIKLADTRKIIEALPSGYWDDNNLYEITCVAYNNFTIDSSVLLTITK